MYEFCLDQSSLVPVRVNRTIHPFFSQTATNSVVHVSLVSLRCFVHFLHEFEFLSPSKQGKSAEPDEKFDSLAYLYVQMCFS